MKIGTYTQKELGNTRTYKRKHKHNKIYRGSLTKRQKDIKNINEKRISVLLVIWFIYATIQTVAGMSNNFVISGGVISQEVSKQANQQLVGEALDLPVSSPQGVGTEQQIRNIAKEHNFKWTDYLIRLAKCENRTLDPEAINDKGNTPIGSVDRGIFQINDYWHSEISDECAFSVKCSTEFAIEMINAGRQNEWVCNKIVLNK